MHSEPNTGEHEQLFPIKITGVSGNIDHPANLGQLCTKGSSLHLTADPRRQAVTRQLYPEVSLSHPQQRHVQSWDTTLTNLAQRFARCIEQHGPDSVAFYVSGQLLTEDYYVFNKLAKGLIGTNNIDSNSRLCMSSAVAGYKQSLGADAPPLSYTDIEAAQTVFITGSNTAYAHPILFKRLQAARNADPSKKLIVVDPRRTDTAAMADLHLSILPGTDIALFNTLLHIMIWERWIDTAFIASHTQQFELLTQRVREMTPKMGAQLCGVREQDLMTAARWFAQSNGTVSLYCQGLNQSRNGTANNSALINLHLATGQIARVGAGPFSLTGQPNAMGGREVGALSNLLPAHRQLSNPEDREIVASQWGVKPLSVQPGKTAVELFEAINAGQIKMVWIVCTNPVQSMPDTDIVKQALGKAQWVVLQEAFKNTATAHFAHVVLPAATWAEKDGTVTNSERRISRVRAAVPAPAEAKPDWWIAAQFAQRLEVQLAKLGIERRTNPNRSLFDYHDAQAIWQEHRATTAGQDLDITALSYAILDAGPQQWPFSEKQYEQASNRLNTQLYLNHQFATVSGKAQFIDTVPRAAGDTLNSTYPLAMTTGRLRDQWHGMSRTGTTGHLFGHCAEPSVDVCAVDAKRLQLQAGDLVTVKSRRGSLILPLQISDSQRVGQVHIAMHWGPEFLNGKGVNQLTNSQRCDQSHQPELKLSAVKIKVAKLEHRLLILLWCKVGQAQQLRHLLTTLFAQADYCYSGLFSLGALAQQGGASDEGVLLRIASSTALPLTVIEAAEALIGINSSTLLRYQDPLQSTHRRVAIVQQQLTYLAIQGDARAESWLRPLLQERADIQAFRASLLMPTPPQFAPKPTDSVVCQCHNVKLSQITSAIALHSKETDNPQTVLQQLKLNLLCGTECGSCVPQLSRLIHQHKALERVHD